MSPAQRIEGNHDHRGTGAAAFGGVRVHAPGPVYAFVPAHGDSKAGVVQNRLGCTWAEGLGLAVLLIDFTPAENLEIRTDRGVDRVHAGGADLRGLNELVETAAWRYEVVCVDLTQAPEDVEAAILKVAHSVFMVSDSSRPSLEMAGAKVKGLRREIKARCALLLRKIPGGLRPDLAEDVVGAPVCGLVETPEQLTRLAHWLALPQEDLAGELLERTA